MLPRHLSLNHHHTRLNPSRSSSRASKRQHAILVNPEAGPPRKRSKISETNADDEVHRSKPTVAPGSGKNRTKARNKRRALVSKLKHFKARGLLPADANTEDLLGLLESRFPEQQPVIRAPRSTLQDKTTTRQGAHEGTLAGFGTGVMQVVVDDDDGGGGGASVGRAAAQHGAAVLQRELRVRPVGYRVARACGQVAVVGRRDVGVRVDLERREG